MKKIFSILFTTFLIIGCTNDEYEALNSDPNNPTDVEAGQLFVSATKTLFDQVEETNVNLNNTRLFSQYWTETTYTDEANYDMQNRSIPKNHWNTIYQNVLFDLKDAKSRAAGDSKKTGQVEVLEVYAWSLLVDVFGDVPYSEALKVADAEYLPKYDDAATIYDDLLSRLDTAISSLQGGGMGFGTADLIYSNNTGSWVKFANSLKVKLGMRLSDVSPAKSKAAVESAAASAFTSNADNATLSYEGSTPNTNPIWVALVQSGRNDFVPANTIVDMLQDTLADPRQDVFFDPKSKKVVGKKATTAGGNVEWFIIYDYDSANKRYRIGIDKREFPTGFDYASLNSLKLFDLWDGSISYKSTDIYWAEYYIYANAELDFSGSTFSDKIREADGFYGIKAEFSFQDNIKYKGGKYAASSTHSAHSHIGTAMFEPSFRGVLLDYAEISFNLAEASMLGYNVPGDAKTHYENGIKANFADWGVTGVDAYLNNPKVSWSTASGTDKVKIARQYWIAMYNRGMEGWYVYRKFDAPQMNLAATSLLKVPKRYTYPQSEQTLNGTNYKAASSAIGGDEQQTKIFWDVNNPPKQIGEN